MQSKISSFFKPPSSLSQPESPFFKDEKDESASGEKKELVIVNTYKLRAPKFDGVSFEGKGNEINRDSTIDSPKKPKTQLTECGTRTPNKKRSLVQLYLELGQSDFLFHECPTCGFKYAPGDEDDEKAHKSFHKNYTHGIQFKGWRNDRVIHVPRLEGGRIILVLDGDSPAHMNKVQEVVNIMETELGEGWIFHKLCKVYLLILSQRIAGCLVAEPIREAFKILSCSVEERTAGATLKKTRSQYTTLQFGEVVLQREVIKRAPSVNSSNAFDGSQTGAIVCDNEALPAVCGIRAIWVSPSKRRKGVGTQLLEAVRRSFCTGLVLEKTQLAFSQPSSAGKAIASNYFSTSSFLVYKTSELSY